MKKRSEEFAARYESLDSIREFVGQAARDAGFDTKKVYSIQLATDEACTNIIEHAYAGKKTGRIDCKCSIADDEMIITLTDQGAPFDPTEVEPPDITADLETRKIGGLGIYLMHKIMDEIEYQPHPVDGNTLKMIKRKS